MSQTTVSSSGQTIGLPGQVADSMDTNDIVSGFNSEASNQLPWGYGLMRGPAGQNSFVLPSGASGTMEVSGLNVFSAAHQRAGNADPNGNFSGDMGASGLLPKASLQVGIRGRFIVPVENTVQPGDRAFCRVVATGALTNGIWSGTNMGGSYVRDCTQQGIFRSSTYTAYDGTTKVAVLEWDAVNKPA